VAIRAGDAPQEELRGVELGATLLHNRPEAGPDDRRRSIYDCVVGALRVRCTIEHPAGPQVSREVTYGSLHDALGPGARRFYGEAFKLRRHSIEDVRVDVESLTADAAARFHTADGGQPATEGLDGGTQPSVSLIDCFVVNLQLAQVLMYELDSLRREDSKTLWMMQSVVTAADSPRPLTSVRPEPLAARTAIVGKRLLPLRGGTWRSVDLQCQLAGIEMRCAFAHELPAGHQPATR
jgi:hypothetical protein